MLTIFQTGTQQLTLEEPDQQLTLQWFTPDGGDRFRDSVFSRDGQTVYALTEQQVLEIRNRRIRSIHSFAEDITPATIAIHPDDNRLAIGAMQRTGDGIYQQEGMILVFDLRTEAITEQWSSGASYNHGASKAIRYTPSGDALYHLYNLNNAGCGRTFDVLERWQADGTYERVNLPSSHAFGLAVTDDVLAVPLSGSCIPMMNNTYLAIVSRQGAEARIFETPDSTGYQEIHFADEGRTMIGSINTIQPPFGSMVHIWQDFDMVDEIEINQTIQSMAISPDNDLIVFSVARDAVPVAIGNDGYAIEIHLYDRQMRRVVMAMELNTSTPMTQVAFSADGQSLLVRNSDQLAILPLD